MDKVKIDDIEVNPDYPILTYHSDTVNELLKRKKIKEENIYNHPSIFQNQVLKKNFISL